MNTLHKTEKKRGEGESETAQMTYMCAESESLFQIFVYHITVLLVIVQRDLVNFPLTYNTK